MANQYARVKRENMKQRCLEYLGGKKCTRCGVDSLPYTCYEFHHVNGNKVCEISKMLNKPWKLIKTELDKCIVLCRNCHGITHYMEG